MIILAVGLLCLFVLPHPWNDAAIATALVWEIAHIPLFVWYSKRGRAQVGVQTLIGQSALVITACVPTGQVRLGGETWIARCETGATAGQKVHVEAVNGLTLLVEHADPSEQLPTGDDANI